MELRIAREMVLNDDEVQIVPRCVAAEVAVPVLQWRGAVFERAVLTLHLEERLRPKKNVGTTN